MKSINPADYAQIFALFYVVTFLMSYFAFDAYSAQKQSAERCVEKGGSYEYMTRHCDYENQHPKVSFPNRSGFNKFLFVGTIIMAVSSLVITILFVRFYFRY